MKYSIHLYIFINYCSLSSFLIIVGNTFSKAKSYWIHERSSVIDKFDSVAVSNQVKVDGITCLAIEYKADDSTQMEINSSDCTQERSVMCQLNIPKALENTTPTIPPSFPCIGSNLGVTNKSKREVESVIQRRNEKPKDGKGKERYVFDMHQSMIYANQ